MRRVADRSSRSRSRSRTASAPSSWSCTISSGSRKKPLARIGSVVPARAAATSSGDPPKRSSTRTEIAAAASNTYSANQIQVAASSARKTRAASVWLLRRRAYSSSPADGQRPALTDDGFVDSGCPRSSGVKAIAFNAAVCCCSLLHARGFVRPTRSKSCESEPKILGSMAACSGSAPAGPGVDRPLAVNQRRLSGRPHSAEMSGRGANQCAGGRPHRHPEPVGERRVVTNTTSGGSGSTDRWKVARPSVRRARQRQAGGRPPMPRGQIAELLLGQAASPRRPRAAPARCPLARGKRQSSSRSSSSCRDSASPPLRAGRQELMQRAVIGFAAALSAGQAESVLTMSTASVWSRNEVEILSTERTWLS